MASKKLDPEFKAKWVKELRGDTFIQHQGGLYDPRNTRAVCCIGVGACALKGVRDITEIKDLLAPNDGDSDKTNVASHMMGLIGLEVPDPDAETVDGEPDVIDAQDRLVSMNDTYNASFSEIADWIEANL